MPTTYNAPNGLTITFEEDYFASYELSNFHRRPFPYAETPMSNKRIRNIQIRYFNVMYDELQRYTMNQPCQMFSFNLPWKLDEDYDITGMRVASNADKTVYALIKNRNTGEEFEEDLREYTIPEVETIVHHIW